jgi:hypothetical protein
MRMFALFLILMTPAAMAQTGPAVVRPLDGPGITQALTDRTLDYPLLDVKQVFHADGRTTYDQTVGQWRVQGDQYCSVWPPSDRWACFDVFATTDGILFVDPAGNASQGFYSD